MSEYRTYRGLHGETFRVRESSIAPAPYEHGFRQYPFAHLAAKAGDKRDVFARFAMNSRYLHEAIKHPLTRRSLMG